VPLLPDSLPGVVMSFRHPQRFAISAILCAFLAAESPSVRLALAADPPPSSHEAAVLDRIFANWKARHDRVHSLHFTFNCRTTYRKGSLDFTTTVMPRPTLKQDKVFDRFGGQLWVDGDDRRCVALTPAFPVPDARQINTERLAYRSVIVGKTLSVYFASPLQETGASARRAFAPYGVRYPCDPGYDTYRSDLAALFFTFRAQTPWLPWSKKEFRVLDENANIDNGHCVKLQRTFEQNGINAPKHEEIYWVSPARDDTVVHWTIQSPPFRDCEGSIKYKRDSRYGWIPSEWTYEMRDASIEECRLTGYSVNEKLDPAIFSLEFQVGTPVEESTDAIAPAKLRRYVVGPDGTKGEISSEEFRRLAGLSSPAKQEPPAKPQAR
jgi:hypothetical protein